MRNRILSWLTYLIGWPFSLIAFIFIIRLIYLQLTKFSGHINQISLPFLIIETIFFMLFYLLKSYVWSRILTYKGYSLRFHDVCLLWLTSEIKRYIPGNIWSFLGRSF